MAIKIESLAKLLVRLKAAPDEAAAKELITSKEEKEVALPAGSEFFTKEELETRDNTTKSNHIKAGKEIGIKELKDLVGLTYDGEGSKDPKKFTEEFQKKILGDANVSTDEKVKDRDKTITKLRENIQTMEANQATLEKKAKDAKTQSDLMIWTGHLKPDNMDEKEWLTLIGMSNELVEENGQMFVKRNGEIVKDSKLQTPVPAKDALVAYVNERKWGKEPAAAGGGGGAAGDGGAAGGRGGGDSKGNTAGITRISQFNKHLEDNKINPLGMEAQAMLTKLTAANKDFDFNS